jgi:hypothetical protein
VERGREDRHQFRFIVCGERRSIWCPRSRTIECGTIDTPNPAATRYTTEEIWGASCPRIGLSPASWQLAMILSWRPGPIVRRTNIKCRSTAQGPTGTPAADY